MHISNCGEMTSPTLPSVVTLSPRMMRAISAADARPTVGVVLACEYVGVNIMLCVQRSGALLETLPSVSKLAATTVDLGRLGRSRVLCTQVE